MEEYKTIIEFDNYEISNTGKVRDKVNDRILNTSVNKGYIIVGLRINGKRYIKDVHRLVAQYFIPDFDKNLAVIHIDGNKTNNTVENLKLTYKGKNKKPFIKTNNKTCCTVVNNFNTLYEFEELLAKLNKNELTNDEQKKLDIIQKQIERNYEYYKYK